jgi:microcystin-dependent protein
MSDPFVAEIKILPGNFAPRGWANCDGQLLPIAQNTALFSLVGTTYGGNGTTNFALPDLQGRVPMHHGSGPGLTGRSLGESNGSETVALLPGEMPAHSHAAQGRTISGTDTSPQARMLAVAAEDSFLARGNRSPVPMHPSSLAPAGGSQPHNNMQPFLALTFVIALQGIFPPRN